MRGKATAIVAIACGVLAGCGSSGSKGAAPTTVANPAHDRAAAQRIVFAKGDLPAGWTGKRSTQDPNDKETNTKMAQCVGASTDADQTADVNGDDFDNGNAEVSSEAVFVKTRDRFEQDAASLRGSKYETCIRQILLPTLKQSIAQESPGLTVGTVSITRFSPSKHGEVSAGFRLQIPVTQSGQAPVNVYDDIVLYGAGRAEVSLGFTNVNAPFDATLERTLSDTAASKLANET